MNEVVMGSSLIPVSYISDSASASSKEFLNIEVNMVYGITSNYVLDMIRTYSQIHHTQKYSQHSSVIWAVWLND